MHGYHQIWSTLGTNTTRTTFRNSLPPTLCISTPWRGVSETTARQSQKSSPAWLRGALSQTDLAASGRSWTAAEDAGKSEATDPHHTHKLHTGSPYERHRSSGILSVSDLVGPAWCEVQFDYGLRQGRSLPISNRPDAFFSAEGKVITVEKGIAKSNDKIMAKGRSIHKELEREITTEEEVVVDIRTAEEFWAVRLMKMLWCLDRLMEGGLCREMPVFGIVQDRIITGIIDEVFIESTTETEAEPSSHNKQPPASVLETPRKSKRRREPSPSQAHLTDFFTSPPSKANSVRSRGYELRLLDTKTRRSDTLPSYDDAFSSRMQLMLYRHLLSALLSPSFSFKMFWERVQVDPSAQFSDEFLLQVGLARQTDGKVLLGYPACLDDLVDLWCSTIHSSPLQSVSPTLEIVYRKQLMHNATTEVSHPRSSTSYDFAVADQEARDLARAIAASLREQDDSDLERVKAESLLDPSTHGDAVVDTASPRPTEGLSDRPDIPWYSRSGVESTQSSVLERPPLPTPNLSELEPPGIIGRRSFVFDEEAMNAYVQDVLRWWHGERPPRGVDVEHSRRCFSCEYREDCEWREMKAREAHEKYIKGKMKDTDSSTV
ncbi:exonuclease V [Lactifluus volemus]|nr:exonuclease V [Lactifluus volemus]